LRIVFSGTVSYERDQSARGHRVSSASLLSTSWLVHMLTKARPYARGMMLDVGCGSKPYQDLFSTSMHLGVDWPNSSYALNIETFADASALPFASSAFDTVLCTEVIEHISKPSLAMAEMARVLRPGGHLILSAPLVHMLHDLPNDFFRYTHLGIQSLARDAGLCPISCWPRGGFGTVLFDLAFRFMVQWLRRLFRRIPFGRQAQPMVLALLVVWPQRFVARLALALDCKRDPSLDTSPKVTLGYVMVAQRSEK
jgi:SAM-dependent methyltransferase